MTQLLEDFKKHSGEVVQSFKKEIGGVRTNRPSPALVEDLRVNHYEQTMPLKQVGSVSVMPPREINIQVCDKSAVPAVVKAIETSNLGLSAQADGNLIRIHLPELSSERREELVKHVKRLTEQYRIQLRHFRDEANKKIQKSFDGREINEDQKFKLKESVQEETDKINKEIDNLLNKKIAEIES